jgi:hypothetical protein
MLYGLLKRLSIPERDSSLSGMTSVSRATIK